jgi:YHS domain-containing protein
VIRFLLLAILLLLIARAFWRLVDGIIEAAGGRSRRSGASPSAPAVKLVRDPVCGTYVAPANALSLTSGGTTHYFCSEDCRKKFRS